MKDITETKEKDGSFVACGDDLPWYDPNDLLLDAAYDDLVEGWIEDAPDGEIKMSTFVELYDIAQTPFTDGDDMQNFATVTSDLKTYVDRMRIKRASGYHIMEGFHIETCINFALLCLAVLNFRFAWLGAHDEDDDRAG